MKGVAGRALPDLPDLQYTPELPDLDDLLARVHVVSLPMAVRFRGVANREVALVEGPAGWGEFAPFPEYDDHESSAWLAAGIEAAYGALPPLVRPEVPVNATVPAVAADRVEAVLARFDGCTTAKVKVAEVGQGLGDDVARVAEVRRAMGPEARVRVDANGAWGVAQAATAIERLAVHDLEYVEQPCATVEELAELRAVLARRGLGVSIAADESIRRAEDPRRVAELGAADVVVVKAAPLGGVARALRVVEACGLPAVVSSALDSSVGISAGVALAAALPRLDHACGLGTAGLFTADVAESPMIPTGGVLRPRKVEPDPARLAELAAPADRQAWCHDRIARCHSLLA